MTSAAEFDATGVDVRQTLGPLSMLTADPTTRFDAHSFERATITPEGVGLIRATWQRGDTDVSVEAWGDGGDWLLDRAPALLGIADDVSSFQPSEPVVRRLWARFRGDRIPRTSTLWHDIAWTIVQQRVHRRDAASQWRCLVTSLGTSVVGAEHLMAPPAPETLARRHPSNFRQFGIDSRRAQALVNAAQVASRLQAFVDLPIDEARPALLSIPGIGPWTVGCLSAFTWGDPDTVIVGDSGIPSLIASVLVGERRATDERMLELLEPYRPNRYRILKLAFASRMR